MDESDSDQCTQYKEEKGGAVSDGLLLGRGLGRY